MSNNLKYILSVGLFKIFELYSCAYQVSAQEQSSTGIGSKIDSLTKVYKIETFNDSSRYLAITDSLLELSRKHTLEKNFIFAIETNKLAEQICLMKWGRMHTKYGSICFNYGKIFGEKAENAEAEKWYLESLEVRANTVGKMHPDYANTLNNLGRLKAINGDWNQAEKYYLETCEIRKKVLGPLHIDYTISLENLGIVYKNKSEFEKAEELYLEVKELREKIVGKDDYLYGNILVSLAVVYKATNRYQEAEKFYLQAYTIVSQTKGKENQSFANILNNLANLYKETGRYESAEKLHNQSIYIKEIIYGKDHLEYGISLSNLANLKIELGQFGEAEELLLAAMRIFSKKQGNNNHYTNALVGLADIYHRMGNYQQAEEYYKQVYSLVHSLKDKDDPKYGKFIVGIAVLYKSMEQFEIAEKYYREAISILVRKKPEYNSNELANCYNSFGNLFLEIKKYDLAEEQFLKAQNIWENNLGKNHVNYAVNLANLAKVAFHTGDHEKAELLFSISDSIWKEKFQNLNENRISHLQVKGKLYHENNHFEKAILWLDQANLLAQDFTYDAVQYFSEQQLNSYASNFLTIQHRLLSLAHNISYNLIEPLRLNYSTLYNNALAYKSLILNATLSMQKWAANDSLSGRILDLLKASHRNLANQYSKPESQRFNTDSLKNTISDLQKSLARSIRTYESVMQKITVKNVRSNLAADEVAIEFVSYRYYNPFRTDSVMYAALIVEANQDEPVFIPLCEEKKIDSIIRDNNLSDVNNPVRYYNIEQNKKLYKYIWKPLETYLNNKKLIFYSPVGLLNKVNFSAIQVDDNFILADFYKLSCLLSTRDLAFDKPKYSEEKQILLYGGIHYDTTSFDEISGSEVAMNDQDQNREMAKELKEKDLFQRNQWPYLKWTEREVKSLFEIGRKSDFDVLVFTKDKAKEKTLDSILMNQQNSPKVIHFATHAYFFPDENTGGHNLREIQQGEPFSQNKDQPLMRSGLLMSGANPYWNGTLISNSSHEDGILTAYEISQMNLSNTELVVLSACETGLGDIKGNEGVYGLQRAFKIAGVKYLMMSLWQVPDRETKEFMVSFYKNWLTKKNSIPDAFRKTQKEMRERFINPYAWAGFVLVE